MTPAEYIEKFGLATGIIVFTLTFFYFKGWPFLTTVVYRDMQERENRRLAIAEQQNNVLIRLEALFSQSVQRTVSIDERTEHIYATAAATHKAVLEHRRDSQRPFEQIDELHTKLIQKVSS